MQAEKLFTREKNSCNNCFFGYLDPFEVIANLKTCGTTKNRVMYSSTEMQRVANNKLLIYRKRWSGNRETLVHECVGSNICFLTLIIFRYFDILNKKV